MSRGTSPTETGTPNAARGTRLWLFRALAALLLPLALLALIEGALWLAGIGFPTAFTMPADRDGVWTTNARFGWRFFPRHLAREPVPLEIVERDPAERAFRIFVVGGSAARGTPDPAYAFGRVLEVLLRKSFPETRFEVHNAAMTAINSHVVLPIVRDLARHRPDLVVVYLGNNEVVGPFGAATVFRAYSPSLGAIRAGNALRATRLGQVLDRGLDRLGRTLAGDPEVPREWRGMEMFLEQRVAFGDPRLETVYEHLRRNLDDTLDAAEGAGARALVATVAVNLRDQPPFASLHRPGLTEADLARWQEHVDAGRDAAEAGRFEDARAHFADALEIDDRWAGLHFQRAQVDAALGRAGEARAAFERARDLDALRFRADSRILQVLRQAADRPGVLLADAEAAFADASAGGVPGGELFYEHVHLTFAGNYALAETVFHTLAGDPSLGERFGRRAGAELPGLEAVAEQLVLTPFDAYDLEQAVLKITTRPPFTGLPGQDERVRLARGALADLRSTLTAELWRASEALYRRRLELFPDDLEIHRRLATRLQARGRPGDAAELWRRLLDRLPRVASWRNAYALALANAGETERAVHELEALLADDPASVEARLNLGTVHQGTGDPGTAIQHFRRVLEIVPDHDLASFNLGTALLESGAVETALEHFRELVREHPDMAAAHHNLGYALERQGDLDGAIASYRRAVAAEPGKANAHNSLGLALEAAGRREEAAAAFRAALHHEPDYALARFNLADLSFSLGQIAEAAEHYEVGLRYRPDNVQARYNWAGALQMLGESRRAVAEFRRVLEARGEDPATLNNLAWILATSVEPGVRNPTEAVELAERAARATDHEAPEILDTLATSYAFAGRLADAVATLERAVALARESGRGPLAEALAQRLAAIRQAAAAADR